MSAAHYPQSAAAPTKPVNAQAEAMTLPGQCSAPVFCLLGPSACGKTALAMQLQQRLPVELISVDSALVYRHMNIGTAKPTAAELVQAPHHLIDVADPDQIYSAGDFYKAALQTIAAIIKRGNYPLCVGGSMLYFNLLCRGMPQLPAADPALREGLQAQIEQHSSLHLQQQLQACDPQAAARIDLHDHKRLIRALEVYQLTGKSLSAWNADCRSPVADNLDLMAIVPTARKLLQQPIATRIEQMLAAGLIDELRQLQQRFALRADMPSMRAVGYRQAWAYLAGECTQQQLLADINHATRRLVKHQMTWLRRFNLNTTLPYADQQLQQRIYDRMARRIEQHQASCCHL